MKEQHVETMHVVSLISVLVENGFNQISTEI